MPSRFDSDGSSRLYKELQNFGKRFSNEASRLSGTTDMKHRSDLSTPRMIYSLVRTRFFWLFSHSRSRDSLSRNDRFQLFEMSLMLTLRERKNTNITLRMFGSNRSYLFVAIAYQMRYFSKARFLFLLVHLKSDALEGLKTSVMVRFFYVTI